MKNLFNTIMTAILAAALLSGCGQGNTAYSEPPASEESSPAAAKSSNEEVQSTPVEENQPTAQPKEVANPAHKDTATPVEPPPAVDNADASGSVQSGAAEGKVESGDMEPTIIDVEGVQINSIVLAKGVLKREPVEPGTQFAVTDGEKIFAIMDVKNETEEMAQMTVSWKMPGSDKEIGKTSLDIKPAKSYRTWSFTRWAKKSGQWQAVVRNANDEVIATAPFEILSN